MAGAMAVINTSSQVLRDGELSMHLSRIQDKIRG